MADYDNIKQRILTKYCSDLSALKDCFDLCIATDDHVTNKDVRKYANKCIQNGGGSEALELYNKTLLFDAQSGGKTGKGDFDCFIRYLECHRELEKRFYYPRRKTLLRIVEAFQQVHDGELDLLTVSQPKRTGKAMPVDTLVLTPNGYRYIGDLRIGDIIISAKGNKTEVVGVFPQGKKEIYEISFSETGKCHDKTIVKCCKDHLWTVRTEEDRASGNYRVMSCEQLMNGTIKRGHDNHNNYSVDYVLPVEFNEYGDRLISPYLMGQLIGDGSFRSGVKITTSDKEVVERFSEELPETDKIVHIFRYEYNIIKKYDIRDERGFLVKSDTAKAIEYYGLNNKFAYEKHIPKEYIYTSVENRIELLRGLFDSDGFPYKNGVEFSTTSKQLAEDVMFVVRSIGGRSRMLKRMGEYKKDGKIIKTRENYRVFCQFPQGILPFWLKRKTERYNTKRKRLYRFIDNIRATGEYTDMVCISVADESEQFVVSEKMIPTHNTTVGLLFVLFRAGNAPNDSSICAGAGNDLVKSFYNGCLDVLQKPDEYLFYDVFPTKLISTNADEKTIHLEKKKRFATITCRSIDGALTGSTEATPNGCLYIDDMVSNELEAISSTRLDTLWDKVRGDLLGRRLEGCPIIAQGTRYSLRDPLGRLQEIAPTMGWRTKVLEIPALDPITDESNFEIILNGKPAFTTEYYRHERELVTPLQWASQFQQEPFEAKGLLFPENELNRYFELPVDVDPDVIVAICDTAERGSDSTSMGIFKIYGEDVFLVDVVFDNSAPEITKPQCAKKLVDYKVSTAVFESNNAGEYYARDVEQLVKELGGKCSIRTKRTISNKQTRIEFASDSIIKNFYFKDKSKYERNSQYGMFMREMTSYTRSGKKAPHDDSVDMLSLAENEFRNLGCNKVTVFQRYF